VTTSNTMKIEPGHMLAVFTAFLLGFTQSGQAQQSKMFGPYELHYSIVNTTFLSPEIAATYGITRGEKRAILNLSVREHMSDKPADITEARAMILKGKTWDLIQNQTLEFQQIKEGPATYYVADFKFINEEWRFFEVYFRPDGAEKTYTFELKHQLYVN
jgi:hypothetical protein